MLASAGSQPDRTTARPDGLTTREIAGKLFITENTAANHVRSILMKIGAGNRTQALPVFRRP